jgi:hypothetical protein
MSWMFKKHRQVRTSSFACGALNKSTIQMRHRTIKHVLGKAMQNLNPTRLQANTTKEPHHEQYFTRKPGINQIDARGDFIVFDKTPAQQL